MTTVARPRGPLPARVYWTRRLLVLGLALGLVFGIAQLLGAGSDPDADQARTVAGVPGTQASVSVPLSTSDAQPKRDSTRDEKRKDKKKKRKPPPLAEPSGPCDPSDLVATPQVKGPAYAASMVTFEIELTTLETPACTWTASSSSLVVKLTSGTDRIWSSQECPASVPTTQVVVRRKVPATVAVSWRGQRSDATCSRTPAWAQPGWYYVEAAAFGAEPTEAHFELERRVRATVTAKPEPEKGPQQDG